MLSVSRHRERMNRHLIFRYYPVIAVICGAIGITAVLVFATADRMAIIGSVIVAILGFCYFVLQQKLSETTLFWTLFTDFNRRYDALNDRLAEIAASESSQELASLDSDDRQTIVDYFNLFAVEYLFFSKGYILPEAWRSWCAGMLWYFDREPFRTLWTKECATNSYYGLSVEVIRRGAG